MGDSPGKRLVLFREGISLTQEAFAMSLGISRAAVSHIEGDARKPSKDILLRISDVYGVSADWLLNGHGEMTRAPGAGFQGRVLRIEPPQYDRPGHGDFRINDADYAMVRRMDLSVSAGNGIVAHEGDAVPGIALPMAFFARARMNSDLSVLVDVKGDSMAPAIPDRALVLVHVAEKSLTQPGVYAFNLDGQSYVKRLLPSDLGKDGRPTTVMVISDNHAYPPIALTGRRLNDLAIVGRVRGVFAAL